MRAWSLPETDGVATSISAAQATPALPDTPVMPAPNRRSQHLRMDLSGALAQAVQGSFDPTGGNYKANVQQAIDLAAALDRNWSPIIE